MLILVDGATQRYRIRKDMNVAINIIGLHNTSVKKSEKPKIAEQNTSEEGCI